VRLFCVCVVVCVGSGLAKGWSPVQGVLPTVCRFKKLRKRPRSEGLYSHKEKEILVEDSHVIRDFVHISKLFLSPLASTSPFICVSLCSRLVASPAPPPPLLTGSQESCRQDVFFDVHHIN
jgi:hypothetical protein